MRWDDYVSLNPLILGAGFQQYHLTYEGVLASLNPLILGAGFQHGRRNVSMRLSVLIP